MHFPPLPIVVVLVACITGIALSQTLGTEESVKSWIEDMVPLAMQVFISLALIGASLYVILSGKYTTPDQHWAYGSIGTLTGYWLKSSVPQRGRTKGKGRSGSDNVSKTPVRSMEDAKSRKIAPSDSADGTS